MPLVSKAQARWAYWKRAQSPHSQAGQAAAEFIEKGPHGKGAYHHLPARVKAGKAVRGGRKPHRKFGSLAMD
jgi:hypothetical protein